MDFARLRAAAAEAAAAAYAPYSGFRVGAAGVVADGRVVVGCNVENASYGLTLCAECGLVSALHATGGGRLIAVSCVGGDGRPLAPCGRCRQLLWEHGGPDLLVDAADQPRRLAELLPGAFDAGDLDRAPDTDQAADTDRASDTDRAADREADPDPGREPSAGVRRQPRDRPLREPAGGALREPAGGADPDPSNVAEGDPVHGPERPGGMTS